MTQLVPLTLGHARTPSGLFAMVDDDDFERVAPMPWRVVVARGYVYAAHDVTFMHRYLIQPPGHLVIKHLNKNGLDNRRENLKPVTVSQNSASGTPRRSYAHRLPTSQFKGVNLIEGRPRPWRATIRVETHQHFLGYHLTEEEAAKAYDTAAVRFFGPFARTNFPVEGA